MVTKLECTRRVVNALYHCRHSAGV